MEGSEPGADLIMMVSHGRGGVARQQYVKLGSIVEGVLEETACPVFLVSAPPSDPASSSTRPTEISSRMRENA